MGTNRTKAERAAKKEERRNVTPKSTALTDELGRYVPPMGGAANRWIRDHLTAGNASTFAVAMALALRADDTLVCWPKVETIATDINSSGATVDRQLTVLEQANIIRIIHLYQGNTQINSVYALNLHWWLNDAPSVIDRITHVRRLAQATGARANPLPPGARMVMPKERKKRTPKKSTPKKRA